MKRQGEQEPVDRTVVGECMSEAIGTALGITLDMNQSVISRVQDEYGDHLTNEEATRIAATMGMLNTEEVQA